MKIAAARVSANPLSNASLKTFLAASTIFMALSVSFSVNTAKAADQSRKNFKSPDILMLGDSQLSFGAGEVVADFFQNIKARCEGIIDQAMLLEEIEKMRVTLVGARSSSLQSWTTTQGWAYDRLCKKDKNWGVNASIFGHGRQKGVPYIQIGEHKDYKFCEKGKTPIEVLFEQGYSPDLLIFNILGNNSKRWAKDPKTADEDVAKFIAQTPAHLKCIYMTTLPIHTKRRNDVRLKAQTAIKAAFERAGNRCEFVETLDAKTISLVQGQNRYFKRKKNGKVKDPFHPKKAAARKVYNLKQNEICQAISSVYMPTVVASAQTLSPTHLSSTNGQAFKSASQVPDKTVFDDKMRAFIQ